MEGRKPAHLRDVIYCCSRLTIPRAIQSLWRQEHVLTGREKRRHHCQIIKQVCLCNRVAHFKRASQFVLPDRAVSRIARCAPWVHKCNRSCPATCTLAQHGSRNVKDSQVSLQLEPPCATSLHKRPRDAPGHAITRCQRIQGNRAFCRCHSFALCSPTIQQASRAGQESFCHLSRPACRVTDEVASCAIGWPR